MNIGRNMDFRGPQPWITNRARVLRDRASSAEALLWARLRGRRFMGLKFVRQHPIASYFADFVCRDLMLVVEVDGATHVTDAERAADKIRQADFEKQGYIVFRVTNPDVYTNLDGVLMSLAEFAKSRRA